MWVVCVYIYIYTFLFCFLEGNARHHKGRRGTKAQKSTHRAKTKRRVEGLGCKGGHQVKLSHNNAPMKVHQMKHERQGAKHAER